MEPRAGAVLRSDPEGLPRGLTGLLAELRLAYVAEAAPIGRLAEIGFEGTIGFQEDSEDVGGGVALRKRAVDCRRLRVDAADDRLASRPPSPRRTAFLNERLFFTAVFRGSCWRKTSVRIE